MSAKHITCSNCGLLNKISVYKKGESYSCSACEQTLHLRKINSLQRTWALVITGLILYVPANMFPMMLTTSLGNTRHDTIMSGVLVLLDQKMYPIAFLVFLASIVIPLFKLLGLLYILISVQFKFKRFKRFKIKLFRFIELIGRWSILDIYIIALMVSLVKIGDVARVEAGIASTAFASVVIITMLAADSFDSRLIWDDDERK